ncbi:MAG TPA: class I tRNA ligase family protein, partial [Methylomicrobium sp.]|nr:class I tRNA ligase family protein [Methylomicrobium sp.]
FLESSWYFAKFACMDAGKGRKQEAASFTCNDAESMLDARANHWLPVDHYIGGIEHAILHLLYARFYNKLLRDEGLIATDEPFKNLLTQGMVLKDGSKMSKSKGNTVDPQALIDQYGADTVRLFIMFAAPPEQSLEWSDSGVEGAFRFLKRLWKLVYQHVEAGSPVKPLDKINLTKEQADLRRQLHHTIQKVSDDFGRRFTFNTAIAANMELVNSLYKFSDETDNGRALLQEALEAIVLMLAPIVPHICHQLWQDLGRNDPIIKAAWPALDESALIQDSLDMVVQINGKLRSKISVPSSASNKEIETLALDDEQIVRLIEGQTIKKVIVVAKKLVNIVI